MLASVRTRVVSWKLAAEMKLSVESDALGDAEKEGAADGGTSAGHEHLLVFGVEAEAVRLLVDEEAGVAYLFDFDPAEHLPDDGSRCACPRWLRPAGGRPPGFR